MFRVLFSKKDFIYRSIHSWLKFDSEMKSNSQLAQKMLVEKIKDKKFDSFSGLVPQSPLSLGFQSQSVDLGLLSLQSVVTALADPRRKVR